MIIIIFFGLAIILDDLISSYMAYSKYRLDSRYKNIALRNLLIALGKNLILAIIMIGYLIDKQSTVKKVK
jgi:hypothetical protein